MCGKDGDGLPKAHVIGKLLAGIWLVIFAPSGYVYSNINKYSDLNAEYYLMYRTYILTIPWQNLLFYDETSFAERGKPHFASLSLSLSLTHTISQFLQISTESTPVPPRATRLMRTRFALDLPTRTRPSTVE